jgi:RimK-like ATP-grasp domain
MKKIGVFFDAPGYDEYPFDQEEYVGSYIELATELHNRGGRFYIVRSQKTFLGGNRFSGGWVFDGKGFTPVKGPVDLDLVYDKGHFVADAKSVVLNERELDDLCVDKWKTVTMFPQHSPRTKLVNNDAELRTALDELARDKVVFKPTDGEEGKGVIIGSKDDVLGSEKAFPALVQEFIDTSGGIPGIASGIHDLRLHSICGDMVLAYVRIPAPGKLVANVSQGGSETEVKPGAMEIFRDIDKHLSRFKRRAYCIDLGLGKDGAWKVIELNSKPGLSYDWRGGGYRLFKQKLVDVFLAD